MALQPLDAAQPLTDDRHAMTRPTRVFMNALARLPMITGSGSPEGVQAARQTRLYLDTAGTAGSVLYVKQVDSITRDTTLGWLLI